MGKLFYSKKIFFVFTQNSTRIIKLPCLTKAHSSLTDPGPTHALNFILFIWHYEITVPSFYTQLSL